MKIGPINVRAAPKKSFWKYFFEELLEVLLYFKVHFKCFNCQLLFDRRNRQRSVYPRATTISSQYQKFMSKTTYFIQFYA
jgi:hypothetical protein